MSDDFLPSHTGIQWHGGHVGTATFGQGNMNVIFYNKSVHNPIKSKEVGYQFNEDKVYVRIQEPGDRFTVIDRPATGDDARRYALQYQQFQQNKQQTAPGAQIELLYPEQPSIAANLRANGIQTIEQCAEMSGHAIDGIMGGQTYCNEAKKWLEMAHKGVHQAQFRAEIEEKDRKIRVLEQQLETLKGQVNAQAQNMQNIPTMQELLALMAQRSNAPQFPPPGILPTPQFDAQGAQIAAAGREIGETARRARGRPRKNAV